jgi:hypothetical protein
VAEDGWAVCEGLLLGLLEPDFVRAGSIVRILQLQGRRGSFDEYTFKISHKVESAMSCFLGRDLLNFVVIIWGI